MIPEAYRNIVRSSRKFLKIFQRSKKFSIFFNVFWNKNILNIPEILKSLRFPESLFACMSPKILECTRKLLEVQWGRVPGNSRNYSRKFQKLLDFFWKVSEKCRNVLKISWLLEIICKSPETSRNVIKSFRKIPEMFWRDYKFLILFLKSFRKFSVI